MRLINIRSLQFGEFFERDIPPYVILSHRWGEDEVSYKQYRKEPALDTPGYRKIVDFCNAVKRRKQAPPDGFPIDSSPDRPIDWVWVDTCCIDKRSSAELSEAINSMFSWYHFSVECYTYLADVDLDKRPDDDFHNILGMLSGSNWFTRGWTLQELLAPQRILFFDARWRLVGHKCTAPGTPYSTTKSGCYYGDDPDGLHGYCLNEMISKVTNIDRIYLGDSDIRARRKASIALRMSWAAQRTTTRREDEAYCLLGLFDINMPLIYGEGYKAFYRLQEEIIRRSRDPTIFAWRLPRALGVTGNGRTLPSAVSVLAERPAYFAESGDMVRVRSEREIRNVSLTNEGVYMYTALWTVPEKILTSHRGVGGGRRSGGKDAYAPGVYLLDLDCETRPGRQRVGIVLVKRDNCFFRIRRDSFGEEFRGLAIATDYQEIRIWAGGEVDY